MSDLSLFVDESGTESAGSKYYLLTLVFHDQSLDIRQHIGAYEQSLSEKGLPNIPFHASPLMNGHDEYKNMDMAERKRLLAAFFVFVRKLPVSYTTFIYDKKEFEDEDALSARMRRDVISFLFDHLGWLQSFDQVKIYYDDGQKIVTRALHGAVEYALSKKSALFRETTSSDLRLSQVADFFCTIELTARKYEAKEATNTDSKVFGVAGSFKKNYLKKVRSQRIQ